jgi:hypothetical protein
MMGNYPGAHRARFGGGQLEKCHHQMKTRWLPTLQDKNADNQQKHGVSFEQAQAAFADPNVLILSDAHHSTDEEERF